MQATRTSRSIPSRKPNRRRVTVLAAAMVVAIAGLFALAQPARAIDFGPSWGGHSEGTIFCDHVGQRIVFSYSARAQVQVVAGDGLYDDIAPASTNKVVVTAEWIEVAAYVKPASGGNWRLVGTRRVLLNSVNTATVMRITLPATPGAYWKAGFTARVAYPGGGWSNAIWEPATAFMSLSGSVSAQYGVCLT